MMHHAESQSLLPTDTVYEVDTDAFKAVEFLKFAAKNTPYFVVDVLRIYCITQVLMQRLTYQVLTELKDNYGKTLPDGLKTSPSFNAALLFGPAALLTLFCKARNIYRKYQSGGGNHFCERIENGKYNTTETKLFALLSGSQGLMLFDLLSSMAKRVDDPAVKLPFWAFGLTASMGFVSLAALFCKLVFPDTDDRFITGRFAALSGPFYPRARRGERVLNGLGGLAAVSAVSAAMWEVSREKNNGTVALSVPELVTIGVVSLASMGMGAVTTTDFPKLFHLFVMASKFIYGSAMAAAAFSGHAYFMLNNPAESAKLPFYMIGWIGFSLMIGVFNALITHYRFEEAHKANLWVLMTLERLFSCCRASDTLSGLEGIGSARASIQVFCPGDNTVTARGSLATSIYSTFTPSPSRRETLEPVVGEECVFHRNAVGV